MDTNKKTIQELRELHREQCQFLALSILALNKLKKQYRVTHNEITLLAVIYFIKSNSRSNWINKTTMKNLLGNWQRAYLHRKIKYLETRGFIWSRVDEDVPIRIYFLSYEGRQLLREFDNLMIMAYDEYINRKTPKNTI